MESSRRPLSPAERRLLACLARRADEPTPGGNLRAAALVGAGCMLPLFGLTLLLSDLSWQVIGLGWLGIWLLVALFVVLPAVFSARRERTARARAFEKALERDEAETIRIRSRRVVEFEELEDLGARWAFELADGRIVFVCGQEYYADARFPNDDFTMVDFLGADGEPVAWFLRRRGKRLEPVRRIPVGDQEGMHLPEHLETLTGRLEDLEQLLSVQEA